MATISPSTFNEMNDYVNVLFQQGVPIADADLNELDAIRQFELRAFLKWFVGEGTLDADAFRIGVAANTEGNFTIGAGDTDSQPRGGCCVADGRIAYIREDIGYVEQPLQVHADRAKAEARAARMGTRVEDDLAAPAADGELTVFLDVFDWVVRFDDEGEDLLLPGLGVETCARRKQEWVVRVWDKDRLPQEGDPDERYQPGHGYFELARIKRRAGDNAIVAADITDRRATRLSLGGLQARLDKLEETLLLPTFSRLPFEPSDATAGSRLSITGRNFTVGQPQVTFIAADDGAETEADLDPAEDVKPNPTATRIVVIVPALDPVVYTIRVTTDGGTSESEATFRVTT